MLAQIQDFKSKRIDLKHLINGFDSLLCALEEVDGGWKPDVQKQWGVLEDVYASALDKNRELNSEDWKQIEIAVEKMKQLVSQVCSEKPGDEL